MLPSPCYIFSDTHLGVGPAEVESILVAHPSVSEAAAVGVPDPIKGQSVVCFVVRDSVQDVDTSALGAPPATPLGEQEWAYFESRGERRVRRFAARAT